MRASRFGGLGFSVVLLAGAVSCTAVLGDDFVVVDDPGSGGVGAGGEAGTAGTAGTGGSAGSGGIGTGGAAGGGAGMSGSCNLSTHLCAPDPGPDWSEPFAVVDHADGCGGAFPTDIGALLDGLSVPSGGCSCSCGSPSVSRPSTYTIRAYSGSACTSQEGTHNPSFNQCYEATYTSYRITVSGPNQSCSAGSVSPSFGDPTWSVDRLACEAAPAGERADTSDTCVARPSAPFQGSICVLQAGDHGCPAGYLTRNEYFQGFDDGRSCPGSCTCSATGAPCSSQVTTYDNSGCLSQYGQHTVDSSSSWCFGGVIDSINPATAAVAGSPTCTPSDPTPIGDVTENGLVTVCCN